MKIFIVVMLLFAGSFVQANEKILTCRAASAVIDSTKMANLGGTVETLEFKLKKTPEERFEGKATVSFEGTPYSLSAYVDIRAEGSEEEITGDISMNLIKNDGTKMTGLGSSHASEINFYDFVFSITNTETIDKLLLNKIDITNGPQIYETFQSDIFKDGDFLLVLIDNCTIN